MLEPDTQLGPFRLIARIGAGGVGEVWKAEDTRLGRIVDIAIEESGDRLVIITEHVEGPRTPAARRFSPLLGGVIAFLVAATLIGAALVWKMPKKRASTTPAPPSTTIAAPSATNGAPASAGASKPRAKAEEPAPRQPRP